jgi:hypothetical protein
MNPVYSPGKVGRHVGNPYPVAKLIASDGTLLPQPIEKRIEVYPIMHDRMVGENHNGWRPLRLRSVEAVVVGMSQLLSAHKRDQGFRQTSGPSCLDFGGLGHEPRMRESRIKLRRTRKRSEIAGDGSEIGRIAELAFPFHFAKLLNPEHGACT